MAIESESYLRELDSGGRVVIPKEIRKKMGLGEKQMLEVTYENVSGKEVIHIEKYNNIVPCAITGKSKKSNQTFTFENGGSITLSPEGIAILQSRLNEYEHDRKSP